MATTTAETDQKRKADDDIQFFAASDFPDLKYFDETVAYPALSVPVRQVGPFKKELKRFILQGQKNVYIPLVDDGRTEESRRRILVFNLGVTQEDVFSCTKNRWNNNDDDDIGEALQWIDDFPITRGYNDMSVDQVLRKLLPNDVVPEIPSGFELVGHLAHVNLRDYCLPYKYWIGRVLLDKNLPTIRTVVNKIGTIESDNVFRTFQQEVLAGYSEEPDWSVTTVYEHGCSFQLDFRHVYWNSRLSGEHQRIVQIIRRNFEDKCNLENSNSPTSFVVVDLMAGIGPFAIPLTSSNLNSKNLRKDTSLQNKNAKITVYANDLNPISYQYLKANASNNSCNDLICSNYDARNFIHKLQTSIPSIDHIIMNLPASAPEFLNAFRGWTLNYLPMIHLHCFGPKLSETKDNFQSILDRCNLSLGCPIINASIVDVRNISPSKNMFCISFRLPEKAKEIPRINIPIIVQKTCSHNNYAKKDCNSCFKKFKSI